jgi:hypothetical protein
MLRERMWSRQLQRAVGVSFIPFKVQGSRFKVRGSRLLDSRFKVIRFKFQKDV